jgi:protein-lysine N-methyltransferase EEF2KMT
MAGSPHDVTVTLRVASVFNDVGLKIWEAGFFLAEYVLAHGDLFTGRSVLELGAGVGITGIIVAKCVRLSRLVMSDYAPKVLLNQRYNTELNEPYVCPVDVDIIDWESWDPHEAKRKTSYIRPDVLLAGDCVYDVAAFPPLVRVLQTFLGDEDHEESMEPVGNNDIQGKTPRRIAIFAATVRNQPTFQTFLDTLAKQQITYEDITQASLTRMGAVPLFPYDNREQIRLCKLYRTVRN